MATIQLSGQIRWPSIISQSTRPTGLSLLLPRNFKTDQKFKWAIKQNLVDQNPSEKTLDVERLVGFLHEDLSHLFDDQGIDRTAYDEQMKFRDPITKLDSISWYLFNIALLKLLFRTDFFLHWAKQSGPYEITTRWTAVMKFMLLPWKPELVFTGTSIMGINPETGNFCTQVDSWDSIKNNDYFSLEGFWDVFKQFRMYKTPDLESPKYHILKRTANYEVRKYTQFIVVETNRDKLSRLTGFNDVAGYVIGNNSIMEKIPITTPVFTQPLENDISSLSKVEGGIAGVLKFSGKSTEDIFHEKEKALRSSLIRDGLKPKTGCLLARYNDPGRTWSFIMRNEVLIWLEEFALD